MDEEYMTPTVKSTEVEDESQKIYCGPNIPSRGLFKYQVFLGGLPFNVKELILAIPEIEKLIVNAVEVDDLRMKINRKGSAENLYYETIKKKVNV